MQTAYEKCSVVMKHTQDILRRGECAKFSQRRRRYCCRVWRRGYIADVRCCRRVVRLASLWRMLCAQESAAIVFTAKHTLLRSQPAFRYRSRQKEASPRRPPRQSPPEAMREGDEAHKDMWSAWRRSAVAGAPQAREPKWHRRRRTVMVAPASVSHATPAARRSAALRRCSEDFVARVVRLCYAIPFYAMSGMCHARWRASR